MYCSFTPYVVTFLHCVANSDADDLQLLRNVVETLQDMATGYELVSRQKTLCAALYRIAKACIESRQRSQHDAGSNDGSQAGSVHGHNQNPTSNGNFATMAEKTLNLPLQPDSVEDWGAFDTIVEDWESQYFSHQSLMLGNTLDQ